jgi:predicted TIM-barrel fold metal-dependent hydrolase
MIVDVHTHNWCGPGHFTPDFCAQAQRARGGEPVDLTATFQGWAGGAPDDCVAIVFGGKARRAGIWVPDAHVAAQVAANRDRAIGFLSLDPTQPGWRNELRAGHEELGLEGVKLMPMYAGFRPDDPVFDELWRYCSDAGLPVLLHTGTTFVARAPLECTLPRHLDPVAMRFPGLRMILAHLGHPYENECVAVIRKHEHVYADVSALHYRPFQLYQSLMLVQEYGVWHKVLFGSDYPFTTVDASVEGLRSLNHMVEGSNLPRLDPERIEAMIHRDPLPRLGLGRPGS